MTDALALSSGNVAGTYTATETAWITLTAMGASETETYLGTNNNVVVTQSGSQFSFTISDASSGISVTRTGTVSGTSISDISGPMLGFAPAPGLVVYENRITTSSGQIYSDRFELNITGYASGSLDGEPGRFDVVSNVVFRPKSTAPTITIQPASKTITTGQTATLSVSASGTAPLSYQWYVGTSGSTSQPISGGTAASFTTPALTTTTSYWVLVSNSVGTANSQTVTVTVIFPPTITTSSPLPSGSVGMAFNQTLTASSGTTPYTWSISSGGLPSGLSLGTGGVISGTPDAPTTASFTARVTGNNGLFSTKTFSLTINAAPTITTGTANGITSTSATLNGTVNPNGLTTTARFEYGLTTAYGATASVTLSPSDGWTTQNVSATLSGLQPGTTYHYRLTATNSLGTVIGNDATFTSGATWDMGAQFSTASNPNGAWSYGWRMSPNGNDFALLPYLYQNTFWLRGYGIWAPSIQAGPSVLPGGVDGNPVVRWICPQTGNYKIESAFTAWDSKGVDVMVWVVIGGVPVFSGEVHGYGNSALYTGNVSFQQGAYIDFVVKWDDRVAPIGGNWTRIIGTISSIPKGDINDNGAVDLTDAIMAMQVLSGVSPVQPINKYADVDADGKIGLTELIYILQRVAGLR